MIQCPSCEHALNLYKRTGKYGYLKGFFVECTDCGFNKYLRRVVTNHISWKIGQSQGYQEAEKDLLKFTYIAVALFFSLGVFVAIVAQLSKLFIW